MHGLSFVRIKNFRACKDVSLPLEGYTPLVGQNNAGKSTILHAIGWVLKPAALSITDFHDPDQPVEVVACIDGISHDVLGRIPELKHRKAITPYCRDGRLWIRAWAAGTSAKKPSKEVWDIEQCPDSDEPRHWRSYPTGLPQAVSALLPEPLIVQAMHDIGEDLGKAKAGTTIKSLLDEIMEPLLEAHEELGRAFDTIRHVLTADGDHRSDHLQQFDTDASDALEYFFPGLALDLDLRVVDVKELFKAGDLHVTDQTTGDRRRFDQMGSGAQRAIQMALIRYLAETRRGEVSSPSRRLLLIDEPELYLHPQGVRRLRQALASLAQFWEDADLAVIEDAYRRAARIFSPAIAHSYVDHLASQQANREDDPEAFLEAIVEARVTVAALGLVMEAQAYFDAEADKLAKTWLSKYREQIKALSDDRRESYRQIIEMSTEPQDAGLLKPEARYEATKANENGKVRVLPVWGSHLLCDHEGKYPADMNDWERIVVETESARSGFSFWYRNPQQPGQSSLGIAYQDADQYKILRPDFIFFAEQDGQVVADIVDPHGLHLADALPKLQGLALYAQNHASAYRRIESVAKVKGSDRLRVLDLKRQEVRDAITAAHDAETLFSSGLASDYN